MHIDIIHVIILALAAYRLCRILIEDAIFSPIRDKIFDKWPPHSNKLSYLLTCYWCLGLYVSVVVVVLYVVAPIPTSIGASVLAISTIVGWIDKKISE